MLYWRLRRRWQARGRPAGREPYLLIRASRLEPSWMPHVLVGKWAGAGRMLEPEDIFARRVTISLVARSANSALYPSSLSFHWNTLPSFALV